MIAAAMESKQLGLCNKTLIVVPNHLVGQWASECYNLYPNAKILASTKKDFESENRKKFCSRIATGDYDIVIIGHSQFERIPLSHQRQEANLYEQIESISCAIDEAETSKSAGGSHLSVKQLESMKKRLEQHLRKLQESPKRDNVVTFEELGVDRLYVDESHNYKNLFLYTKMTNVAGIGQTDAQKASDMFMKSRYIDEITGGKGIVHATGTPLSNTMAELYATQRYLQYDLLQQMGLGSFDSWASTFGETITSTELDPTGAGYRQRTRFAKFFNLPELTNLYRMVADVQTKDMLDLPIPDVEYKTVVLEPSEQQKELVQSLAKRAEAIHKGSVDRKSDNMLCVTNDGRKLALDQRLVDPTLPDEPNSKVRACANIIYDLYREGDAQKCTQLVFCDTSTPKKDQFNVYDALKAELVKKGIPAQEVRFVHEANTDAAKEALFSQVRNGTVRVLMGSTSKLGTGTNVQDRLIAGHDMDCPYRPSDLEQRAGRVARQGNQYDRVKMFRYVKSATFDAYLYQMNENKQRFISQIFTSKSPVRVANDIDEISLNYAEIKALASGNPLVQEKVSLDIDIARLRMLRNKHRSNQMELQYYVNKKWPADLESQKKHLENLQKDFDLANNHPACERLVDGIVIKGNVFEKAADAGNAIFEVLEGIPSETMYPVGSYRGFTLCGYKEKGNQSIYFTDLYLVGSEKYRINLNYANPAGSLSRINKVVDHMAQRISDCEEHISRVSRQIVDGTKELSVPFDKEKELREKEAKLKELDFTLNLDKKPPEPVISQDIASTSPTAHDLEFMLVSAASRSSLQNRNSIVSEKERLER